MKVLLIVALFALVGSSSLPGASPEDLAFFLEQYPGPADNMRDVLVVASWSADGLQGFSYGICFDPAKARIGRSESYPYNPSLCCRSPLEPCSEVRCMSGLATFCARGNSPDFNLVAVYENGLTHGVVCFDAGMTSKPATERCEILRITFELLGEEDAAVEFCNVLGSPPVATVLVLRGASIAPARQEGVILKRDTSFRRGDSNGDGAIDIADPVSLLARLFADGGPFFCSDASDANDDGQLDIADPVTILNVLFGGTPPLPSSFGSCGRDQTNSDALDCLIYEACP